MRFAICDDEKLFRDSLIELLNLYRKKRAVVFSIDEFQCGESLIKSSQKYNIIFLDYQMKSLNGIETARMLRKFNNKAKIIFLTSHPDVVFESFEVKTFRFLVKPVNKDKLFKALDDYLLSLNEAEYLVLNRPNIAKIKYDDIVYIEATGKTCIIHTLDGQIKYSRVMADIEQLLPKDRFFKSHKSFIVGLKHVKERIDKDIILDNNDKVFLAVANTAKFKEAFINYMKRYVFITN